MTSPDRCGAVLTIDLDAIAANYRLLRDRLGGTQCGAVVKADAYGLGMAKVAPVLFGAGCKVFFVAHIDEGIELRRILDGADIHVFNGILPGTEADFAEYRLSPVLNSLGEIESWAKFLAASTMPPLPADIHIDTGMSRLGLPHGELVTLLGERRRMPSFDVAYIISHLACADQPTHPMNARQLNEFRSALAALPAARASLANSSAIFLGPDYHFDLARPGVALYGVNPTPKNINPMAQVVSLQGKILQTRVIDSPRTVGYGATHSVVKGGRIATVAMGYADGYLRSLGNSGCGFCGGVRAPVVGRISMDLITLDVSAVAEHLCRPGSLVEMIGADNPVDSVAAGGGTIGYEVLTSLGGRYHRVYRDSSV